MLSFLGKIRVLPTAAIPTAAGGAFGLVDFSEDEEKSNFSYMDFY
jgi:hypothetical protein